MKKKLFSVVILAILVLGLSSCTLGEHLKVEYKTVDNIIELKSFKGTSKELQFTVPDEYEGKPVTKLGDFSIANAEYIETLTIGKNINDISIWAISNCPKLKKINVDANNTKYMSIDGVLYTKDQKQLVSYPNMKSKTYTVLDGTEEIANDAFYKCINIEEVVLPNSIIKISDRAFMKCAELKKLEIPNNVKSIGADGISFCPKLESLFIPKSVETIGNYAFFGCSSLTEMKLERENSDAMTIGDGWLPVKGKSVDARIPVVYSQIREAN
ncbi:MAG: leucine-rich repeat protein [Oscillospiraceae bacterium]